MKNTGYQQAVIAKKTSRPGNLPLDVDGNLCSDSGKKQAILLLEGEENPYPGLYDVEGTFGYGDIIEGYDTRIYNPQACPLPQYEDIFEANKSSLYYPVSRDGMGFDIEDRVVVTSCYEDVYADYVVTSAPSWLTTTKGNVSGKTSTLNLTIGRNRDSDNEKSGVIVLTQNDTGKVIRINIRQAGRLIDGIPTEYPYVNRDTVLGEEYDVVQVGEQIWLRTGLRAEAVNAPFWTQSRADAWQALYPDLTSPTPEEFNPLMGRVYNKQGKNEIIAKLIEENGDTTESPDIYKHQLPVSNVDSYEFFAFLLARAGGVIANSTGTSTAKERLNVSVDGYDDVRLAYPERWVDNPNMISEKYPPLKTGTDDYALGFMTLGNYHPTEPHASEYRLFYFGEFHVKDGNVDPQNSSVKYNSYGVEISNEWEKDYRGWNIREQNVGFHAKQIRTVRYRKLDWDIYDNGSEIRRIKNGDPIPEGFTLVPRGARRGAWFGNPDIEYNQIGVIEWNIYNMLNIKSGLG